MTAILDAPASEPKIVVLVRLLNAIDEGNHSFESLKDRVAEGGRRPSTRSLRRYLSILAEAGFPCHFDRASNAYRFAGGYSLKRLDLSNGELFGLVALRSLGASIGGAIGSSIDEVTEKLVGTAGRGARMHADAESPVAFRLSEIRLDAHGERAFALLSAAERSLAHRPVLVSRQGRSPHHAHDRPYGFVINAGRIYCVGYDHDRSEKRTFAIDNVSDPDVLGNTFAEAAAASASASTPPARSAACCTATRRSPSRSRFAARVAKAAIAARVVEERRVERRSDGSALITYVVSDAEELVRWVLGWGAQAEIVDPPEARARIATLASEVANKYSLRSVFLSGGTQRRTCHPERRRGEAEAVEGPQNNETREAKPPRVPTYSLTGLACLVLGWENLTDVDRRFDRFLGTSLIATFHAAFRSRPIRVSRFELNVEVRAS